MLHLKSNMKSDIDQEKEKNRAQEENGCLQ